MIHRAMLLSVLILMTSLTAPLSAADRPAPEFPASPDAPPPAGMVKLADVAPDIIIDLKYAGPDNFTGQTLYPHATCYLRKDAAERLARVQAELAGQSLGLKVWDCFRPLSVQRRMWEIVPNPNFVADPRKGSRHNVGTAVDLTLTDASGHELPMPTPFDHFGREACSNFQDLPEEVIANRELLKKVMRRHGFQPISTEWWHFNYSR